jgi:hypothetical protein
MVFYSFIMKTDTIALIEAKILAGWGSASKIVAESR